MSAPEDDAQGIYQAAAQTILTQHFSDLPRSAVVVLFACTIYGPEKDALQHTVFYQAVCCTTHFHTVYQRSSACCCLVLHLLFG
jgi:hypothetical protein